MSKKTKIGISIAIGVVFLAVVYAITVLLLNKLSVPNKEERLRNMQAYCEQDKMRKSDVPGEIEAVLAKFTNWDNLFLSEHFKAKYKNRKNIIDEASRVSKIWCGSSTENEDEVIVYAYKAKSLFSSNDSEDIATEYIFKYILDDNGEIDDLIRIDKFDVYVINGEPVE